VTSSTHPRATHPPISTVVITHNEELNIERCLRSVAGISDEIVVVDSGSSDRTAELATQLGARVIVNDWPGYGPQKRFAVARARNEWILSIDADEEVSADLAAEIEALSFSMDAYAVPRAVWYFGRWIRHGVWYPGYVVRLFRRDHAAFTNDLIHESVQVRGRTGRLQNDLLHYSYRDMDHHLLKMEEFSSLGAQQLYARGRGGSLLHLAFRPPFEFFKSYVLKRGFLDGQAGLMVAALHAQFIFLKYAKLMGLEWASRGKSGGRGDGSGD
jgi:glycosyltransferase involved in cell wall biosynthesis